MKVFFWKADDAGCGTYRCAFPAEGLRLLGHQAAASVRWKRSIAGEDWNRPDVVVGQRVAAPLASATWHKRNDVFRIYEMDDDLWRLPPTNPGAVFWGNPDTQHLVRANIQAADRVVVSTAPLAQRVWEETNHADIRVLPNLVPDRALRMVELPPEFTVGWSGSPTHKLDWAEFASPLRQWLRRNPDVRFVTVGASYLKVPNGQHIEWEPNVEKSWDLLNFHVGLAPLRPSTFNQSKSPLKALEYMARGIPAVASNTGPYQKFVIHGGTGYLVPSAHSLGPLLNNLKADWETGVDQMRWNAMGQAETWTIERSYQEIEWTYTP